MDNYSSASLKRARINGFIGIFTETLGIDNKYI